MTHPPRSRKVAAAVLLGAALAVGGLAVLVCYGFESEYGNTQKPWGMLARDSLLAWIPAYVVVGLVAGGAVLVHRRRWTGLAAAGVVLVVTAGVPTAAVLGVEAKYDRYPATPRCDASTEGGRWDADTARVLAKAEREFVAIGHPGRFSGGGSAGIGGCESVLVLRPGVEPLPAYVRALPRAGWTVTDVDADNLRADKGESRLLVRLREGQWMVRISPA